MNNPDIISNILKFISKHNIQDLRAVSKTWRYVIDKLYGDILFKGRVRVSLELPRKIRCITDNFIVLKDGSFIPLKVMTGESKNLKVGQKLIFDNHNTKFYSKTLFKDVIGIYFPETNTHAIINLQDPTNIYRKINAAYSCSVNNTFTVGVILDNDCHKLSLIQIKEDANTHELIFDDAFDLNYGGMIDEIRIVTYDYMSDTLIVKVHDDNDYAFNFEAQYDPRLGNFKSAAVVQLSENDIYKFYKRIGSLRYYYSTAEENIYCILDVNNNEPLYAGPIIFSHINESHYLKIRDRPTPNNATPLIYELYGNDIDTQNLLGMSISGLPLAILKNPTRKLIVRGNFLIFFTNDTVIYYVWVWDIKRAAGKLVYMDDTCVHLDRLKDCGVDGIFMVLSGRGKRKLIVLV